MCVPKERHTLTISSLKLLLYRYAAAQSKVGSLMPPYIIWTGTGDPFDLGFHHLCLPEQKQKVPSKVTRLGSVEDNKNSCTCSGKTGPSILSANEDLILAPHSSRGTAVWHVEVSSIFSTNQTGRPLKTSAWKTESGQRTDHRSLSSQDCALRWSHLLGRPLGS